MRVIGSCCIHVHDSHIADNVMLLGAETQADSEHDNVEIIRAHSQESADISAAGGGMYFSVVIRARLVVHALLRVNVGNCADGIVVLRLGIRCRQVCWLLVQLLEGDPLL